MSVRPASSSLSGADGSGGLLVRARRPGGEDPRVVGVREVIEHQAQRLGRGARGAGAGLGLLAARN
jgi:hypothetical protein